MSITLLCALFHSVLLYEAVKIADMMLAVVDNRDYMKRYQLIVVAVLSTMSVFSLLLCQGEQGIWHMGGIVLLFIIAVEDAITGYVYDIAGISLWFFSLVCSLVKGPMQWESYEVEIVLMFLGLWIVFVALEWMGTGDLPLLFALLLYYMAFCEQPMYAVIFMYLVSQLIYAVFAVILREKALPLVPALYIAHVFTLCVWA